MRVRRKCARSENTDTQCRNSRYYNWLGIAAVATCAHAKFKSNCYSGAAAAPPAAQVGNRKQLHRCRAAMASSATAPVHVQVVSDMLDVQERGEIASSWRSSACASSERLTKRPLTLGLFSALILRMA